MYSDLDVCAMAIAERQSGVITRRQALAVGVTDRMICHRTTTGLWKRVGLGVYAMYPAPPDRLQLAVAVAKLSATVSHEAAAQLYGFGPIPQGRIVVTVPHRTSNRCRDVTVHESTDLAPDHVAVFEQLPVTTPERTVVDLAAVVRPKRLALVVQGAIVAKRVDVARLRSCFESVARRGKPGVAALRMILDDLVDAALAVESELESRLMSLLLDSGLPTPIPQYRLPWRPTTSGRVDFAYPESRLIVECDGRRWHTSVESFEVDRRRDNLAQLAGWRVLRFTWSDVTRSEQYVIQAVRSALRGV